jgi:hypothetical protein
VSNNTLCRCKPEPQTGLPWSSIGRYVHTHDSCSGNGRSPYVWNLCSLRKTLVPNVRTKLLSVQPAALISSYIVRGPVYSRVCDVLCMCRTLTSFKLSFLDTHECWWVQALMLLSCGRRAECIIFARQHVASGWLGRHAIMVFATGHLTTHGGATRRGDRWHSSQYGEGKVYVAFH